MHTSLLPLLPDGRVPTAPAPDRVAQQGQGQGQGGTVGTSEDRFERITSCVQLIL